MVEPVDRAQRRRLPGAVRPDQRHDLALADGDRDPLEGLDRAVERVDVLDLEDVAGLGRCGSRHDPVPSSACLPR